MLSEGAATPLVSLVLVHSECLFSNVPGDPDATIISCTHVQVIGDEVVVVSVHHDHQIVVHQHDDCRVAVRWLKYSTSTPRRNALKCSITATYKEPIVLVL